jgi:hypothetical protein
MLYETVTDTPRIASPDYMKMEKPIEPDEGNEWTWMQYTGSGVSISDHPLNNRCHMRGCGDCESGNVIVIFGRWCVSTASGDEYWDYEIRCNDCGKFTARSFSEN